MWVWNRVTYSHYSHTHPPHGSAGASQHRGLEGGEFLLKWGVEDDNYHKCCLLFGVLFSEVKGGEGGGVRMGLGAPVVCTVLPINPSLLNWFSSFASREGN